MMNVNRVKFAIAAAAIFASVPAMATRSAESLPAKSQGSKAVTASLSGKGKGVGHQTSNGKGHENGKGKGHIKYDSPG